MRAGCSADSVPALRWAEASDAAAEVARVVSDLHQLAYPLQLLDETLAHQPRVAAAPHLCVLDLVPQAGEEWQQLFEPVATGTQFSLWRPRSR